MIRSKGKMNIIVLIITNVCKNVLCLGTVYILNVVLNYIHHLILTVSEVVPRYGHYIVVELREKEVE